MKAGLFPLVWMLSAAKLQPPFSSPALRSLHSRPGRSGSFGSTDLQSLFLSLSLFRPHVASDEAYVCTQLWLRLRLLGEHERAVEAQATYVAMDVPLPVATTGGAGGAPGLKEARIRVFGVLKGLTRGTVEFPPFPDSRVLGGPGVLAYSSHIVT